MKYSSLILALIIFTGCVNQQQVYNKAVIKKQKEYTFDLLIPENNRTYGVQYDSVSKHIFVSFDKEYFGVFNLNNKQQELNIQSPKKQKIDGFYFLNEDSIFITHAPAYQKGYNHSGTFYLANIDGEILREYSFDQLPVRSNAKPDLSKDEFYYVDLHSIKPINNKIYFKLDRFGLINFSDSLFQEKNYSIGGYFDLKKDSVVLEKEIKHPSIGEDSFLQNSMATPVLVIGENNKLLYSFRYTSEIIARENNEIKHYATKTAFIDTVMPSKEFSWDQPLQDYYTGLDYDPFHNRYIRYSGFVSHRTGFPERYAMSFYDADFNLLGETLIPDSLTISRFITEDGICFYNKKQTYANPGKLCYSCYDVSFEKRPKSELDSLIAPLKNPKAELAKNCEIPNQTAEKSNILEYANQIPKMDTDSSALLVLQVEVGCPGCTQNMLTFISANLEAFSQTNMKVALIAENKMQSISLLKDFGLNPENKMFYYDTEPKYFDYNNGDNSTRLVILKNNEVTFDDVFLPNDLVNLQIKLIQEFFPHAEFDEVDTQK